MNTDKLLRKMSKHPLIRSDISLQVQFGLPLLEKRNECLCMSFKPHKEILENGKLFVYPQQYEVEFIYPFNHIIKFNNLIYYQKIDLSKPISFIDPQWMATKGKYILNELYNACDRVLKFQEQDGKVSDLSISKYQKIYYDTAESLGLLELYNNQ